MDIIIIFLDIVKRQPHLQLFITHDLIIKDNNKPVENGGDAVIAVARKTPTPTVSSIPVCRRYLTAFYNYDC